jgi:hypothetical protein
MLEPTANQKIEDVCVQDVSSSSSPKGKITGQRATESNVLRRISNALHASAVRPLLSLLRLYRQSRIRLAVLEIRGFPLRIAVSCGNPLLRYGNTLYSPNRDRSMGTFEEENRYSRACMNHIQELERDHHWVASLDLELAAQSHRAGALWAMDNFCSGMQYKEPAQNSCDSPKSQD